MPGNNVPQEAPSVSLQPRRGHRAVRESKGHPERYGVLGPGNIEVGARAWKTVNEDSWTSQGGGAEQQHLDVCEAAQVHDG